LNLLFVLIFYGNKDSLSIPQLFHPLNDLNPLPSGYNLIQLHHCATDDFLENPLHK